MEIKEKVGKIVEINGGFVVIDKTSKKDDGKGFAEVVFIFAKDIKERNEEIKAVDMKFVLVGGGCIECGKTHFCINSIWRSNSLNNTALNDHIDDTKMVVVYNSETLEYFLLMSEDVSIADAKNFLFEVNLYHFISLEESSEPIANFFYKTLRLPHKTGLGELCTTGSPRFEVVLKNGIAIIQLQVF